MRASLLFGLCAFAACHTPPTVGVSTADTNVARSHFSTAQRARPDVLLDEVEGDDIAGFISLDHSTRDVVESEAFRAVLERLGPVDVSPGGRWISGWTLSRVYLGYSPDYTSEPTCFRRKISSGKITATTELAPNCGYRTDHAPYALTVVHGEVLERQAELPEGRACAINTLAHEWTHAIADAKMRILFTDDGYQHFDDPVVSYTVGAVAQCVFLQRWRPQLDLNVCIQAAGTRSFRACTCEAGWLDALIAGETSCR